MCTRDLFNVFVCVGLWLIVCCCLVRLFECVLSCVLIVYVIVCVVCDLLCDVVWIDVVWELVVIVRMLVCVFCLWLFVW